MRMETRIWGAIPMEILERVIAFLPLPSLSRFQCVNKWFNAYILSDKFLEVCEGLLLRKAPLFVCKNGQTFCLEVSVCVKMLDFVTKYVQPHHEPECSLRCYSAHGSLALVTCGGLSACDDIIFNLALRTCTRVPRNPFWDLELQPPWYGIVPVEGGPKNTDFKIMLFQRYMFSWELHMYDPIDGSWRKLHLQLGSYQLGYWLTCAVFHDKLVVVFSRDCDFDCSSHNLVTISIEGDDEGSVVKFQRMNDVVHPRLVTDGKRLFLAGWRHARVQVWEVNRSIQKFVKVFRIPMSMKKKSKEGANYLYNLMIHKDSFFFRLSYDKAAIYDMTQKVWRCARSLERDRREKAPPVPFTERISFFLDVGEDCWDERINIFLSES